MTPVPVDTTQESPAPVDSTQLFLYSNPVLNANAQSDSMYKLFTISKHLWQFNNAGFMDTFPWTTARGKHQSIPSLLLCIDITWAVWINTTERLDCIQRDTDHLNGGPPGDQTISNQHIHTTFDLCA